MLNGTGFIFWFAGDRHSNGRTPLESLNGSLAIPNGKESTSEFLAHSFNSLTHFSTFFLTILSVYINIYQLCSMYMHVCMYVHMFIDFILRTLAFIHSFIHSVYNFECLFIILASTPELHNS